MEGMIEERPQQQPTRFTRKFTPAEVAEALKQYLANDGHRIPEGKTSLWGLEHRYSYDHRDDSGVTLVIQEVSL